MKKYDSKAEEKWHKQYPNYIRPAPTLKYIIECTYTPDFIHPIDNTIIEIKGNFTPEDRRKMLLIKQQYPNYKIIMIFVKPYNKLSKKSKMTYAKWCENNNIEWKSL